MTARRDEIVDFLNHLLDIDGVPGDKSANGLQVEGAAEIRKIAGAVDACQAVYDEAIAAGAQLIFVHHGEFWGPGIRAVTGRMAKRFGSLLSNEISLYAAHLPLDADPDIGHNACICDALDIRDVVPFAKYAGVDVGLHGHLSQPTTVAQLRAQLDTLLDTTCTSLNFGGESFRSIAVISGAGACALQECANLGIDVLVTGEYGHTDYHVARELGINLVAAGHYATETPGVHAVLSILHDEFGIDTTFIHHPTGL